MTTRHHRRAMATGAAVVGLALTLAACSGDAETTPESTGNGGEGAETNDALDAALERGGDLTYWTWTPSAEAQVEAFMDAYPNVNVEVVDTGGAADNNLDLQNAISAGSGVPDVVQVEYQALPQFVLPGALLDLSEYGFGEYESLYTPSTWGAVSFSEGIWGLPQDSGPMALFYNKRVFDEYGIEVPATWDEFVEAGRTLRESGDDVWITNDYGGDAGFGTSMMWQAGGLPFQIDGENVTIDLQDEGTTRWAETWNPLIEEDLLADIPGWSDEWFTALSDGTIASLPIGAWMPGVLESSAPGGAGDWAVAPMPTYDGEPATAENGGSSQAVTAQSEDPELAAAFLRWLNASDESVEVFLASGGFPATVADLESEEFQAYESEYFGGQRINEVLVDATNSVLPGWQYLPWQAYANSIYPDTVGQAYLSGADLNEGLLNWQDQNIQYGSDQGFTVNP
ncbi:ABC transporter substrate-binding protein [Demequina aestuarii]|uniref:ABC transporter substrate-binding protein n=1 Tax=Demequina aestuarii TaxID=327095 RepID=UPI000784F1D9|nr:sugar ABC transporter substrate-binding protein [Demequina aestuarii]